MIHATVFDLNDIELGRVYLRYKPSVNENLWFVGDLGERLRKDKGASSFTIKTVSHWVGEEWTPNTHTGDPIHSIALHVAPNLRN